MNDKWSTRFELIAYFGWMALGALFLGIIGAVISQPAEKWFLIFAVLLALPAFVYTYVVVIWHWKDRYRGQRSDLWGALILIETSGWTKLIYLFRHLIPDMRGKGRYAR